MGKIAEAAGARAGFKLLDDSEQLGASLLSVSRQIKGMASSWLTVTAQAEDAEDTAVLDARLAAAVATVRSQVAFSDAEKAVITQLIDSILE